jgi:tetratricopeptide (TPR) repeat protein
MSKSPEFSRQLKKAVRAKDWDSLETILVDDVVNQLDHSDKENIAELLYTHGEELLELSLIEQAFRVFEKCLRLDIAAQKSWIKFAEANLRLGILREDVELINKADELFSHADYLVKTSGNKLPVQTLWDWGTTIYAIAKDSEEAVDYKNALEKFNEAYSYGLESASFLLDYGTIMGEMGMLIGNPNVLMESSALLEKSIQSNGDKPSSWLRLACTFKILYFMTGDVVFFEKADQSFVAAARLFPVETQKEEMIEDAYHELWVNWAQLLVFEGKVTNDPELLSAGLEKLELAERKKPHDPVVLTVMGDALTHLGVFEEHFESFKEAEAKLELANQLFPGNHDIISHLAHCLANMGKYLSEPKYLHLAIEKFHMGISQDKNSYYLWHGLAMANLMLADISGEAELYEKVSKFCAQAIHLGGDLPAYWNDWGVSLMKLGEITNEPRHIAEAIEKFEGAIQCYNRKSVGQVDPDWFYNYGCALDWMGSYDPNPQYFERAISILSRLHDQYPALMHIRYNLGLALYHLGDTIGDVELLERAIEHFTIYIREETEDDTAISDLGLAHLTLGDILQENIPNQRSIDCFSQAEYYLLHSIALGNTRANYYVACLNALADNVTQAIQFLERARSHDNLPPKDVLLEDDWMDPIRETPEFLAFIQKIP